MGNSFKFVGGKLVQRSDEEQARLDRSKVAQATRKPIKRRTPRAKEPFVMLTLSHVEKLLGESAGEYLDETVDTVVAALRGGDVIVHTSRLLIKTSDAAESLRIARTVSAAVVAVVNRTLKTFPPRFVIAKGGITSSDVAAHGLEIRHAIVRGPMLPGIVSLWEPVDGPAKGIPYIVFAGNVGDDQSLADVTRKLSNTF